MNKNDLTQGSIKAAIRRIAIPSSIGFLFNTLFNVVDTFYAGQLSVTALAGLTAAFPIFIIIIALASGVGTGSTALAAISLGKKDHHDYHKLAKNALFFSSLIAIFLVVMMPFILPVLFSISGAEGAVLDAGISYMYIIMGAAIFQILNFTFNGLLSAQGNTKPFRNFLIIGFLLNLFLDPLFIFGWFGLPELGTAGVALATVVVQALGTLYLGWSFFRSPLFDKQHFRVVKINQGTMKALLKQGLPVSLSNATIAIGIFVIQFFIYRYGNDQTLAGYGVAVRIEQIALLPTIGLNIATLAIAGQNYGAQLYARISQTYRQAIKYAVILLSIGLLILYPFAPQFVAFFNNDPNVIAEGVGYLRIEGLAIFTYSLIGISTSILQAIKKPYLGLLIGLLRQLSPILVFYVLGDLLGLGMNGVWWGIVIVNYLATLLAWALVSKLLKPLLKSTL